VDAHDNAIAQREEFEGIVPFKRLRPEPWLELIRSADTKDKQSNGWGVCKREGCRNGILDPTGAFLESKTPAQTAYHLLIIHLYYLSTWLRGLTGRHSPTGFTLVEAMVASMILLLVMGSVLAVAGRGDEITSTTSVARHAFRKCSSRKGGRAAVQLEPDADLAGTFNRPTRYRRASTPVKSRPARYDPSNNNGTTTVLKVTLSVTWTNQTTAN